MTNQPGNEVAGSTNSIGMEEPLAPKGAALEGRKD